MLQMFGLQYIFFSFTQLNKRKDIFIKMPSVTLLLLYQDKIFMDYVFCFAKKKKKNWLFELICFKEDLYFILFFSFKSYKLDL